MKAESRGQKSSCPVCFTTHREPDGGFFFRPLASGGHRAELGRVRVRALSL
jgi:hypothetical protein